MQKVQAKTKKSNTERYSDDVWACIRAVYEADGGSSIERVLDIVRNTTQIFDLPSRSTVVARAKREKWQRPDSLVQLSTAKLEKIIQRCRGYFDLIGVSNEPDQEENHEDNQHYEQQMALDAYNSDTLYHEKRQNIINAAGDGVKKLLSNYTHRKKNKAEVIKRARNLSDRAHLILAHTLDNIVLSKELMTNVQYRLLSNDIDKANLEMTLNLNMSFLDKINLTVASIEKLHKSDFALYGLTPEDLKEPETGNRMQDLNDDAAYEAQKLKLDEQVRMVRTRREYIESGQMEEEVMADVRAQMAELEDGVDVSEDDLEE
nr:hypothetical protein [Acinetobacter oleivorans]